MTMPEDYFDCEDCCRGFCGPGPRCDACQKMSVAVLSADHVFGRKCAGRMGSDVLALSVARYRTAAQGFALWQSDRAHEAQLDKLREEFAVVSKAANHLLDKALQLATFLKGAVPGALRDGESAIDAAIRVIGNLKDTIAARDRGIELTADLCRAETRALSAEDEAAVAGYEKWQKGADIAVDVLLPIIRKHHPKPEPVKPRDHRLDWADRISAAVNNRSGHADLGRVIEELRAAAEADK